MTLPIPTEDMEQRIFVQWLRLNNIAHFRVPNETYTKSWSQKAKNKALGVSPGVCDLFVALPGVGLIGIEMKRTKKSVTSNEQKQWIEVLNSCPGVQAFICRGADEAIKVVESMLHQPQLVITETADGYQATLKPQKPTKLNKKDLKSSMKLTVNIKKSSPKRSTMF